MISIFKKLDETILQLFYMIFKLLCKVPKFIYYYVVTSNKQLLCEKLLYTNANMRTSVFVSLFLLTWNNKNCY